MKRSLLAAALAATITCGCGSAHSVAVDPSSGVTQRDATGFGQETYSFKFFAGPAEDEQHQMAAGPDGNVWFRDTRAKKIGYITPAGLATEFALPRGHAVAFGIAAGPDGNIWYTDGFGHSVGRITMTGVVTLFALPYAREAYDVAGGGDGNVWFTATKPQTGAWWIGKITPGGAMSFYAVPGPGAILNDINLGPDGNVWYANGGSKTIGRVTPSGTITEFATPSGIVPKGIVQATNGDLYSAVEGPSGTLLKITPSGTISVIVDPNNAHPFDVITEGPNHCIWGGRVCGNGGECLDLFNVNRVGFVEYQFPSSTTALAGLIAGPDGNIWFQVSSAKNIPDGLGKLNTW
jgi:streptogramin lyase